MERSVKIGKKSYKFNIGMRVFATWLKKNKVGADELASGNIPMGLYEIGEIFAMGVRAVGKQKLTTEQALDLFDEPGAFAKVSEEVTECMTLVANRVGGEVETTEDDDEKE